MRWRIGRRDYHRELLREVGRVTELLEAQADVSGASKRLDIESLDKAAESWRRLLWYRLAGHLLLNMFIVIVVVFVLSTYSGRPLDRTYRWRDLSISTDHLDMSAVNTLVVTSTALIASITIAVVIAPQVSAARHPGDRIAAANWGPSVSSAAFLLSAASSGVALVSLFRSTTAIAQDGGGWHLIPLILIGGFLTLMTWSKAEDDVAVSAPERSLVRIERQIAAIAATGVQSAEFWRLRWVRWGLLVSLLSAAISMLAFIALTGTDLAGVAALQYVFVELFLACLAVIILSLCEWVRVESTKRGWRNSSVLLVILAIVAALGPAGWALSLALDRGISLAGMLEWLLLVAPAVVVAFSYLISFVDSSQRPRLTLGGGVAATVLRDLERRREQTASRIKVNSSLGNEPSAG